MAETIKHIMDKIGTNAKAAFSALALATTEQKNTALIHAAKSLRRHTANIIQANRADVEAAKKAGAAASLLDRLLLNEARIEAMALALESIAAMPDVVGDTLAEWDRPNGLTISRVVVPLGVIGIIYESRPNVTADAGALCLKSNNAVILRGGSESLLSSQAILKCLHEGLRAAQLPEAAIQLVPTTDREAVNIMLHMSGIIDVIIPRGGKSLTSLVQQESRVPTLLHLDGNCHTYIHAKANPDMVEKIVLNAKMRRTGVCGATESLVIDKAIASKIVPSIVKSLASASCELRGDAQAQKIDNRIKPASEEDWGTEYLDAILSIKIVEDIDEAISHINRYGSHHTDAIITDDKAAAELFCHKIDSAIVMHNTSTQFADGGEFGMGAEIGIATGRLHARGPVGAAQLTTYKYVVRGKGQIRPI